MGGRVFTSRLRPQSLKWQFRFYGLPFTVSYVEAPTDGGCSYYGRRMLQSLMLLIMIDWMYCDGPG